MPEINLSEIGARGIVIFFNGAYHFVTEDRWRDNGTLETAPKAYEALSQLKAVIARVEDGNCYVDLDRLGELEASTLTTEGKDQFKAAVPSIILRENEQLVQVPLSEFTPLDEGFEGDAGVIVTRGALLGAIPRNSIPSGTYCVLINLDMLK